MKKSNFKIATQIIMTAAIITCTINLKAQNTVPEATAVNKKAEFGIRFMPTFSNLDLKTSDGNKVKGEATLGYGIGGLLGFNFNKHIGVQGEVIYSSLSQKYQDQNIERKVNLKYINIPLLLSLNSGKSNAVNLNLVVGPQIGVNVGSSVYSSGSNGTNDPEPVVSIRKGDLGFAFGGGVDFGLNTDRTIRLSLGYRGVIGLFDISDDNQSTATESFLVIDKANVNTNAAYMGLSILF